MLLPGSKSFRRSAAAWPTSLASVPVYHLSEHERSALKGVSWRLFARIPTVVQPRFTIFAAARNSFVV